MVRFEARAVEPEKTAVEWVAHLEDTTGKRLGVVE